MINNGKLTAKKVTGVKRVLVQAASADGNAVSNVCTVTIYPATTAVSIYDSTGANVTNNKAEVVFEENMSFTLKNAPASAMQGWTAKSANKGVTCEVEGDRLTLKCDTTRTIKANTKVAITVTAADGSNKNAKVTVTVK